MFLNRFVFGSTLGIIIVLFMSITFDGKSKAQPNNHPEMVPNVVAIKFKTDPKIENSLMKVSSPDLSNLLSEHSITSMQQLVKRKQLQKVNTTFHDIHNIYYVSFSGNRSPVEIATSLERNPLIEYAEPKYVRYITAIPNDTLYYRQKWYLDKIQAAQSWDIVKGQDGQAVIAIVDGGTNIHHPDLTDNIWTNDAEVNGAEGVDDDGNGYIDDLYGWNFAGDNGDPTGLLLNNGNHGTLTAGIVSAISNNLTGVAGVSWNATVMAINVSHKTEDWKIDYGFEGIIYAAQNGADIISCSWGGIDYSIAGRDVIEYATELGAVVVAAAGNDGIKNDPFYPASYRHALSIGGTDINDNMWTNSNHGPDIDLAAPADSIFCMLADGTYIYASGTSVAAPIVAGVVGLVKAQNPNWKGIQAGEQVRVTADSILSAGEDLGRGRVNAYRALTESPISIQFVTYDYVDEDGNEFIETGERVNLYLTVINYLAPASNISLKISSSSNKINLINEEVMLSSIDIFEPIRLPDPFVFDVVEDMKGNPVIEFDLQIKADGYQNTDQFTFDQVFKDVVWIKYDDPETTDPPFSSGDPVLHPGPAGDWDDSFVSVRSVIYDTLSLTFMMWYQGGNGPYTGSIGYATSGDGINWTKYDNPNTTDPPFSASDPVLSPGPQGAWDSRVAGMSSVVIEDNLYHMWYTGVSDSAHFDIGYASSSDGINWAKYEDNPVLERGPEGSWDETRAYLPCVIFDNSIFKMWYAGTEGNPITGENFQGRIGYATSPDGIIWTKKNTPVLEPQRSFPEEFDYWSLLSPGVIFEGDKYQMWYAGTNNGKYNIGIARSLNGIRWYRSDNNPVLNVGSADEWDYPLVQNPTTILIDSTYHMWYSAGQLFGWQIGYARSEWGDILGEINSHNSVDIPNNFTLSQNYPNPFNPVTIIEFQIPNPKFVNLSIYNLLGQKVATLVNEQKMAGYHQVKWDGMGFASGVYFYRIEVGDPARRTGESQEVKKMILLQ
jgi:subtilisin family serine protease/predicted GH43/DUF377 family glycosyl hydrolase